jgi:hypothetical protein
MSPLQKPFFIVFNKNGMSSDKTTFGVDFNNVNIKKIVL